MILLFNDLIVLIQYNLNLNKKERYMQCVDAIHIFEIGCTIYYIKSKKIGRFHKNNRFIYCVHCKIKCTARIYKIDIDL